MGNMLGWMAYYRMKKEYEEYSYEEYDDHPRIY
jgi:hypothetical protein